MNDYSKIWGRAYDLYSSSRIEDCSESIILSIILKRFEIKSMVDFGCAIGRWCKVGKDLGIEEVLGLDGEYINRDALVIDKNEFIGVDLGGRIELSKRYDLAISLEVAEHLSEEKSDIFIDNLTHASDCILFSAAVPGQGGDFHVNEQLTSYWQKKFENRGYYLYDYLRPIIWNNNKVMPMYKQNSVLYIKRDKENRNYACNDHVIDVVHPEIFASMAYRGIMLFPFHKIKKDSTLVIYGAGTVGNQYYRQLKATNYCKKIIWIDKNKTQACVNGQSVDLQPLESLFEAEIDYYIIAVENEKTAQEIIRTLIMCYNIEADRIVYQMIRITRY